MSAQSEVSLSELFARHLGWAYDAGNEGEAFSVAEHASQLVSALDPMQRTAPVPDLDWVASVMANNYPVLAIIRALDKCAPGIRGAFAPPSLAASPTNAELLAQVDESAAFAEQAVRQRDQALAARPPDFVPGVMHCAKCKFRLVRTNLYIASGTFGAGDNKTEPCPNGCGPLWPTTWEREARECWARMEEFAIAERPTIGWLPMTSAPRDGTMLRLLVEFEDHATEDVHGPAPTIGANNFDHDGEDEWKFAGWCWTHDHFTQGVGKPIGWMPMLDATVPSYG